MKRMFGKVKKYSYTIDKLEGGRMLVVPDIHGCLHTFLRLLEKVEYSANDTLIILGDIINRGKYSIPLVDYLIKLKEENANVHIIRGNHENQVSYYLANSSKSEELKNSSIGRLFTRSHKNEQHYVNFFDEMPFFIEYKDFVFVHAGLGLGRNPYEGFFDMISIKDMIYDEAKHKGKTIIHGHKPKNYNDIEKSIAAKEKVINLDNGCVVYKKFPKKGRLTCFNVDTYELVAVRNVDDLPED